MSSDATLSDENLPARPVLKDAQTVAGWQDIGAMPACGSVSPSNARQRAAWHGALASAALVEGTGSERGLDGFLAITGTYM